MKKGSRRSHFSEMVLVRSQSFWSMPERIKSLSGELLIMR